MTSEEKIAEQIKAYQEAAKDSPKVDVASLMINALEQSAQNRISSKQKHWAYLIALSAPPLGLIFAAKFWFVDAEKEDSRNAAYICIGLTVFSIVLFMVFMKIFFSSSGTSVQQIEQIHPSDIYQLTQ